MPVFMLAFSVAFSFFMYVIPANTGLIPKLILAAGLAAAGNLAFVTAAPDLAMATLN
jgi:hypothetical protein